MMTPTTVTSVDKRCFSVSSVGVSAWGAAVPIVED